MKLILTINTDSFVSMSSSAFSSSITIVSPTGSDPGTISGGTSSTSETSRSNIFSPAIFSMSQLTRISPVSASPSVFTPSEGPTTTPSSSTTPFTTIISEKQTTTTVGSHDATTARATSDARSSSSITSGVTAAPTADSNAATASALSPHPSLSTRSIVGISCAVVVLLAILFFLLYSHCMKRNKARRGHMGEFVRPPRPRLVPIHKQQKALQHSTQAAPMSFLLLRASPRTLIFQRLPALRSLLAAFQPRSVRSSAPSSLHALIALRMRLPRPTATSRGPTRTRAQLSPPGWMTA